MKRMKSLLPRKIQKIFQTPAPWMKKRKTYLLGALFLLGLGALWLPFSIWICQLGITSLGPIVYKTTRKQKQKQALERQWPMFLQALSSNLKAGQNIEQSILRLCEKTSEPLGHELRIILAEMSFGKTLQECLRDLASRHAGFSTESLFLASQISAKSGASLAPILQRLSIGLRENQKIKGRVRSLTSQGRMQAYSCSMLPVLLYVTVNWISPGYFSFFFNDLLGKVLMGACICSLFIGFVLIQNLSTIVTDYD
ncbi:MAG: type II secretion system F family protein [Bdellovibrionota bacterium]